MPKLEVMTIAPEDDKGGFISKRLGQCWICGGPTHRVDICFETFLHYTRCADLADEHYWHEIGDDKSYDPQHDNCCLCETREIGNN